MSDQKSKKKSNFKIPVLFRMIQKVFPFLEKFVPLLANRIAVYAFFSPLRFKSPEKELDAFREAQKSYVMVEGKKVQIYLWGNDGPFILMTHGWSGRGTQFWKFIGPFTAAGYRIISFDGPAHGRSDGRSTNITEFVEVIRQLKSEYNTVVGSIGHSFGGVANLLAHSEGVTMNKVIMISSPTITDDIVHEAVKKLNGSTARETYLKKYIFKKFGVEFEEVGALKLIENVQKTEVLLIHDIEDREVSIRHAEALIKKYPEAKLLRTEGLGHIRILKNDEVIQACIHFFDSQDLEIGIGDKIKSKNIRS